MKNAPTNSDDTIDSRDVIERIEELQFERDNHPESPETWAEEYKEDAAELAALEALQAEVEGYGDWRHGMTLIRDDYFQTYAEQLANDTGAINRDARWPMNCIDWEQAAKELKSGYSCAEFAGVTYWYAG